MAEYIEREALLKGIDEFHHTAHIQSITTSVGRYAKGVTAMKYIIASVIVVVITLAICVLIFEAVWNSDLPMWLKWLILK